MKEADKELVLQACATNDWDGFVDLPRLIKIVRADERERATRENAYVLAEREAILELVDSYAKSNTDLANAIRARGNT